MTRFVSRPGVVVAAAQYNGGSLPMDLAHAVLQRRQDGGLDINGVDGPVRCKPTDWVIRDRDGQFSVMRDAAFEVMFEPQLPLQPVEEPRVKRVYTRRMHENV